jgi:ArsR family metal-binding transcriptional regulator
VKVLTTFGRREEFLAARAALEALHLPYEVLSPDPVYARVGTPCLVMDAEVRMALASRIGHEFVSAGWVEYRPAAPHPGPLPASGVREDIENILGEVAIMVLAPCVADATRIRLVAHIGGDLEPVLPYLNAVMPSALYNPHIRSLTYMEQYRAITLYGRRITIAKADDIVDAWRLLESIRVRVADTWVRRKTIEPCHTMRERPPVIEIYKRLPRTNCRACGEPSCMAFAARVFDGARPVTECRQVFGGEYGHLRDDLLALAGALGTAEP